MSAEIFWGGSYEETRAPDGAVLRMGVVHDVVLCVRNDGPLQQIHSDAIMAAGSRIAQRHRRLCVFADWRQVDRYETSCRVTMTDWAVKLGDSLEGYHLVTHSRIVQMGAAVASMMFRRIHVYSDIARFRETFDKRVAS